MTPADMQWLFYAGEQIMAHGPHDFLFLIVFDQQVSFEHCLVIKLREGITHCHPSVEYFVIVLHLMHL